MVQSFRLHSRRNSHLEGELIRKRKPRLQSPLGRSVTGDGREPQSAALNQIHHVPIQDGTGWRWRKLRKGPETPSV